MMSGGQRYESEWEGLRLVIEKRPDHFQVFVYDPAECEVLYTCEQMSLDAAEFAAVNFAATARFGPGHDLKPQIIAAMLLWEPTSGNRGERYFIRKASLRSGAGHGRTGDICTRNCSGRIIG